MKRTIVVNGRKYSAVDEAGDDFSNVAEVLRSTADSLEEEEYSEEARLDAIKSLMPLIGQMRAGISVNEEGEEENLEFDEPTEDDEPVEEDIEGDECGDTPTEDESVIVLNGQKYVKAVDEKAPPKKRVSAKGNRKPAEEKKPVRNVK